MRLEAYQRLHGWGAQTVVIGPNALYNDLWHPREPRVRRAWFVRHDGDWWLAGEEDLPWGEPA